jgi:hypothetical protein
MPLLDCKDRKIDDTLDQLAKKDSDIDWVILGHVKQTFKIEVQESGKGFKNMVDEFAEGKIQYGLFKATVAEVSKTAFIAWMGNSVQGAMQGKFQIFVKDMEYYLKGRYHNIIIAHSDEDLDEKDILKSLKVGIFDYDAQNKSSGQKSHTVESSKQSLVTQEKTVTKQDRQGSIR